VARKLKTRGERTTCVRVLAWKIPKRDKACKASIAITSRVKQSEFHIAIETIPARRQENCCYSRLNVFHLTIRQNEWHLESVLSLNYYGAVVPVFISREAGSPGDFRRASSSLASDPSHTEQPCRCSPIDPLIRSDWAMAVEDFRQLALGASRSSVSISEARAHRDEDEPPRRGPSLFSRRRCMLDQS